MHSRRRGKWGHQGEAARCSETADRARDRTGHTDQDQFKLNKSQEAEKTVGLPEAIGFKACFSFSAVGLGSVRSITCGMRVETPASKRVGSLCEAPRTILLGWVRDGLPCNLALGWANTWLAWSYFCAFMKITTIFFSFLFVLYTYIYIYIYMYIWEKNL